MPVQCIGQRGIANSKNTAIGHEKPNKKFEPSPFVQSIRIVCRFAGSFPGKWNSTIEGKGVQKYIKNYLINFFVNLAFNDGLLHWMRWIAIANDGLHQQFVGCNPSRPTWHWNFIGYVPFWGEGKGKLINLKIIFLFFL